MSPNEDPIAALSKAIGRKADVVVDVTAKAPSALGQAVRLARPGGTIVLAGVRASTETPGFDPDHIVYKELRILGALGRGCICLSKSARSFGIKSISVCRSPQADCWV